MKRFFTGWVIILSLISYVQAQNVNFSQFHLSPVQTNPAMIATQNQMQVVLNYRNQFIGQGSAYETPMVSVIYPWIKGITKRKAGFGLSFLQDKTGEDGLLTTTGGLATAAFNFNLRPANGGDSTVRKYSMYLSVGGQIGFFQRRVNEEAVSTGNQWIGDGTIGEALGEPAIPEGELFNLSTAFPLMNLGGLLYWADHCGNQKAYFGINMQNVNQPNVAFLGDQNALNPQWVITGGYTFNVGGDLFPVFSIQPNLRWIRIAKSDEYRMGSLFYYNFASGQREGFFGEGKLGLGAWYDSNADMAIGVEVHQPKYFLGFSYDLGASEPLNSLGNAAVELSLGIKFGKKCLEERVPKERDPIRDTIYITERVEGEVKGDSLFTIVNTIEDEVIAFSDTVSRRFIVDPDSKILVPSEEELKIFKRKVFFYYISADINATAAILLDQIADLMKKYRGVEIKISGHTCNIGKDNQTLSLERAQAVKNYLVDKGIDASRMTTDGFADTQPVLSNRSEFGRIKNRRTEFTVTATGAE